MNNPAFRKTTENVRKQSDINVAVERRRNYLALGSNYHTTNSFTETLPTELKKKTLRNKLVHLGLLIVDSSKIRRYEFWCDYVKPKYGEKKSCVMWIQIISLRT